MAFLQWSLWLQPEVLYNIITYFLTFTKTVQINRYYPFITGTHMPWDVKHGALTPNFTHAYTLQFHLGWHVATRLKTTITAHTTAWELHPVNKSVSSLPLITEICLLFSPAHPVYTQEAQEKDMDEWIYSYSRFVVYYYTCTKRFGKNCRTGASLRGSTSF